jgi:RHS repeat-associated protein
VIYELDTTGNVRRLHAGQRFSQSYPDGFDPDYTGDLGGNAYSAFGKRLALDGTDAPPSTTIGFNQPFAWQGKPSLGANLYYSRARIWSADLGSFLQPDQYVFLSRGGTLWSWPGQNPFRWADPSGRFGVRDVNGFLFWLDDHGVFQAYGDYASGLSSALTFGLSDKLIGATGLGKFGDKCSTGRRVGEIAGTALGLAGLAGTARSLVNAARGTLTAVERAEIQAIANQFKTEIRVVGSRAAGRGRNVGTNLPVGKGPGTRSDIDFIIDGQVDISARGALTDALRNVGNGAGSVISPRGFSSPPHIVFTPGGG